MKKTEKGKGSPVVDAVFNTVVQKDELREVSQPKSQVEGKIGAKALRWKSSGHS